MKIHKIAGEIDVGSLRGFGELGLEGTTGGQSVYVLANVLSIALGILTIVGFIWALYMLVIGAIGIISSGGDKTKYADARNKITYGVIGIVVLIAAFFIVRLIEFITGINILGVASFVCTFAPC